ncbi:MAG: TetR/AcrR family transcriptional regulator [Thermodesulfobacteriota bacterium]
MPSETRQQLLDAAEELFAQQGYQATSLRQITGRAGANLAAVNYHFGSKEALIEAVLLRRLMDLNQTRSMRITAVLDSARKLGRPPAAREVLRAFIEPTIEFGCADAGSRHVLTLIGRSFVEPDSLVRKVFMRLISPLFLQMLAALQACLPSLPAEVLHRRLHFALGATSHTLHMLGKPGPAGTTEPMDDAPQTIGRLLVDFLCAGMEAPA